MIWIYVNKLCSSVKDRIVTEEQNLECLKSNDHVPENEFDKLWSLLKTWTRLNKKYVKRDI